MSQNKHRKGDNEVWYSQVCDRCKKRPIPFECSDQPKSPGKKAYYHLVPADMGDPTTLMSNGKLMFAVYAFLTHPVDDETKFFCFDCFQEIFKDDFLEERDEDSWNGEEDP